MKTSMLAGKTVAELKAMAKKLKITLSSAAKRADIVRLLTRSGASDKPAAKVKARTGTKTKAKTAAKVKSKAKAKVKAKAKAKAKAKVKAKATTKTKIKAKSRGKASTAARAAAKRTTPRRPRAVKGEREPLWAQERVEDAKYYTGPLDHQHRTGGGLPLEYGRERITLLARDPDTVYCYWEVPKARVEKERVQQGKGSRLCVRVYDITGVRFDGTNATSFFDQEVFERVGSWYFELRRPSHAFCADIGVRTPAGRFRTIARSNTLFTPAGGMSDLAEDEGPMTEDQLFQIFGAAAESARGLSSEQLREWVRLHRGAAVSSPGMWSWGSPGGARR